ncbi:MAG TPA: 16S rRNA (guanine(527)-N(7))-methyltransferase RsmG [Ktedonobacteraceae bacterium]|nr:16S rRNA (guanine(527)-N(7))-methyltransferase RsmG [Ktedonobacteraceae bacterium]
MSEDNPGGGKPRPSISKNSSADKHNGGAGLAPARPTSPAQQISPSLINLAQPASTARVNLAYQPFLEGLDKLGLELTEQQSKQFLRYQQELLDWNTRVNLTSITKPEEVLIKHFLDSLSLLLAFDAPEARLLDIGTGAGFPGLPLKIVRPRWQLLLLEATGKKVAFLQHLIETLHVTSIAAMHGRAEELAHKGQYRAAFDVVTARAVASLPALLEYASPFCRVGGQIILQKKGDLTGELANGVRAADKVGAVLKDDIAVKLPGLDDGRRLLVWEQVRKCPAQFPRSGSVMAKKPLG